MGSRTTREPVYVVDIIGDVVTAVKTALAMNINYVYGRHIQILETLQRASSDVDQSVQAARYPLIALFQDFAERRGDNSYYANVSLRIVIACLTNSTDPTPIRYAATFKPILYPVYYEFLNQLIRNPRVVEKETTLLRHIKWDRPGTLPENTGTNDFVDAIEIQNLTFSINQNLIC